MHPAEWWWFFEAKMPPEKMNASAHKWQELYELLE